MELGFYQKGKEIKYVENILCSDFSEDKKEYVLYKSWALSFGSEQDGENAPLRCIERSIWENNSDVIYLGRTVEDLDLSEKKKIYLSYFLDSKYLFEKINEKVRFIVKCGREAITLYFDNPEFYSSCEVFGLERAHILYIWMPPFYSEKGKKIEVLWKDRYFFDAEEDLSFPAYLLWDEEWIESVRQSQKIVTAETRAIKKAELIQKKHDLLKEVSETEEHLKNLNEAISKQ